MMMGENCCSEACDTTSLTALSSGEGTCIRPTGNKYFRTPRSQRANRHHIYIKGTFGGEMGQCYVFVRFSGEVWLMCRWIPPVPPNVTATLSREVEAWLVVLKLCHERTPDRKETVRDNCAV